VRSTSTLSRDRDAYLDGSQPQTKRELRRDCSSFVPPPRTRGYLHTAISVSLTVELARLLRIRLGSSVSPECRSPGMADVGRLAPCRWRSRFCLPLWFVS